MAPGRNPIENRDDKSRKVQKVWENKSWDRSPWGSMGWDGLGNPSLLAQSRAEQESQCSRNSHGAGTSKEESHGTGTLMEQGIPWNRDPDPIPCGSRGLRGSGAVPTSRIQKCFSGSQSLLPSTGNSIAPDNPHIPVARRREPPLPSTSWWLRQWITQIPGYSRAGANGEGGFGTQFQRAGASLEQGWECSRSGRLRGWDVPAAPTGMEALGSTGGHWEPWGALGGHWEHWGALGTPGGTGGHWQGRPRPGMLQDPAASGAPMGKVSGM